MAVKKRTGLLAAITTVALSAAHADENLFGYVSGAETLPQDAAATYLFLTQRKDKGQGYYSAQDADLEYEYGVTHRLTAAVALKALSVDTNGLVIDGYLPGAENYALKRSAISAKLKYNFLSAARDPVGLSGTMELKHGWLDPHSGKDKDTTKAEFGLQLQKLFLDDQLVAVLNTGLEATYAKRAPLDATTQADADAAMQVLTGDPAASFEWPAHPEMEIELKLGGGMSWRFAPNWFIGAETLYQTEFETEVGMERYSLFAGPSLHYGDQQGWATLTWFEQLQGGREQYINQADADLHLIEKTKQEVRIKLGYNF